MSLISKKFPLHIFPLFVHVFYADTLEESYEAFRKKYHTNFDDVHKFGAMAFHCTDQDYNYPNLIALILAKDKIKTPVATIMHECNHAAMYALDTCGVPISKPNSEIFCYVSEYIFKQTCKILGVSLDIPNQ
jgi:hypothetical protein